MVTDTKKVLNMMVNQEHLMKPIKMVGMKYILTKY